MSPLRVSPGSDPRRGSCTGDGDLKLLTVGDFPLYACDMNVSSLRANPPEVGGEQFLRQYADFETDCCANLCGFSFQD